MKTHGNSYVKGSCKNRVKPPNENPIFSSSELLDKIKEVAIEFTIPDYLRKVVYFLFQDDKLVYVGKSEKYHIYDRCRSHAKSKKFNKVLVIPLHTEDNAIDTEQAFINVTSPKYNKYRSTDAFILNKNEDVLSAVYYVGRKQI